MLSEEGDGEEGDEEDGEGHRRATLLHFWRYSLSEVLGR